MTEQEIRKDQTRRIKGYARQWRTENEGILLRYKNLLDKGMTEEDAERVVMEAFNLKTPQRIRNIRNRVIGFASPGMRAIGEVMVAKQIAKLMAHVDEAVENAEMELDKIEAAEENDEEWLEVEETEDDSPRGGKKTKRVPLAEARRRWMRERLDYDQRVFDAIKSIIPQTVLQQHIGDNKYDQYSMKDLDAQIAAEEKKIKGKNKGEDDADA